MNIVSAFCERCGRNMEVYLIEDPLSRIMHYTTELTLVSDHEARRMRMVCTHGHTVAQVGLSLEKNTPQAY
jgi:hypothetical protein